jgi:CDP-diacylglycerol--serine O-phosphatidyltransferase
MLLAMLVDMADGFLARRLGLESEFGKNLDSFCDVFAYLVLPEFILFQMGMQDLVSACALFAFLTAGLLRLSNNTTGTVTSTPAVSRGLQVIWSQLVWFRFPCGIGWCGGVIRCQGVGCWLYS